MKFSATVASSLLLLPVLRAFQGQNVRFEAKVKRGFLSKNSVVPGSESDRTSIQQDRPSGLADEVGEILRTGLLKTVDRVWDTVDRRLFEIDNIEEDPLEKFGEMLMKFEEKFLAKISTSPTSSYLESLSTLDLSAIKAEFSLKIPMNNTDDSKHEAAEVIESATEPVVSLDASTMESIELNNVDKVDDVLQVDEPLAEVISKNEKSATIQEPPPEVKNVLQNLQSQAVHFYQQDTAADGSQEVKEASIAKQEEIEAELNALVQIVNKETFSISSENQAKLVECIEALEKCLSAAEVSLGNEKLTGDWALVYASSKSIFADLIGKKRGRLFKFSSPIQHIDLKNRTVENKALFRLRFTPLKMWVSQRGTFEVIDQDIVSNGLRVRLSFQKGKWGKILTLLRKVTCEASVTYVSDNWRLCRSGSAFFAFERID